MAIFGAGCIAGKALRGFAGSASGVAWIFSLRNHAGLGASLAENTVRLNWLVGRGTRDAHSLRAYLGRLPGFENFRLRMP